MNSTRRRFFGVASAAAAWLLQPFRGGAQTTPSPSPAPTPSAVPPALGAVARQRYGKFLSPEDQKLLEERLAAMERRGGRLRSVRLGNAEEPVTDFHVRRPKEDR